MRRRGFIMVVTLAALAGLLVVISAIAVSQRTAFTAQFNRMEARRARLAAEAGIQRAMAEFAEQQPNLTGQADNWYALGNFGSERFVVRDGSFRVQIVDASGLIDLNSAPEDQLQRLPLTSEQIDSLLDWRSGERDPRPEGAKDEYYRNLANPYNAKLAALHSVSELLRIRGFTPAALYEHQEDVVSTVTLVQGDEEEQPVLAELVTVGSRSLNVGADGQPKLNVAQATIGQMVQRGVPAAVAAAIFQQRNGLQSMSQVLRVPGVTAQNAGSIVDALTVGAQTEPAGRINVNTASEAVLNSLPNMPADVATAIVQRQSTPFASVGELMTLPGFSLDLLQQHVDRLTVTSLTYLIRVVGKAGDAEVALEALVEVRDGTPRLLRIEEASFPDMAQRWDWDDEPTNDIVLIEEE